MSERKAFNFYKSYYDVACELSDKDRLSFYDALIKKQFFGIEQNLEGMAKFAYISQKHNIDSQISGWEFKTKCKLQLIEIQPSIPPTEGGWQGGSKGASQQEKEKEKEKEEEKEEEKRKGVKKFTPPTLSEVVDYFIQNGYSELAAKKAFYYYEAGDWYDSKNNKVKRWKQKMQAVWFKDENKINQQKSENKIPFTLNGLKDEDYNPR